MDRYVGVGVDVPMIKNKKDRVSVLHSFVIMIRNPRLDRGVGMFVA